MKHFLMTVMSLACLSASAAYIAPDASLQRALQDGRQRVKGSATEFRQLNIESATDVYVFQGPQGFVVAPADDTAPALLGYGTGKAGSNPEFDYFMGYLSRRVKQAARSGAVARISRPEREPIEPLCKTTWNQNSPYNDDCPEDDGGKCVTGCVATSTAQLMKYHNWPPKATGEGLYYLYYDDESKRETHEVDLNNYTFDWDNMLDSYLDGDQPVGTEEQRAAVANLMAAVGAGVNMMYTSNMSGAYSQFIGPALIQNFGYSRDMRFEERDCYGLYDWEEMIYNSLKTCGPVVYGGSSPAGGHSFICDGYSQDGLFHINWGWGGMSDGYFLLDVLDPENQGIGGSDYHFNENQNVVLYAKPATPENPGTPAYQLKAPYGMSYSPFNTEIANGDQFSVGSMYNYSADTFPETWYIGAVYESLYDPKDSSQGFGLIDSELPVLYGFQSITFDFTEELAKGMYKVYVATSVDDDLTTVWPVQIPLQFPQFVLGFVNEDGELRFRQLYTLLPRVSDMQYPAEVQLGENIIDIAGRAFNQGDSEMNLTVRAELIRDGEVVMHGVSQTITIPAGETVDINYNSNELDVEKDGMPIPDGEYRLALSVQNSSTGIWVPIAETAAVNVKADLSGIVRVTSGDAEVEWFDLQGRRVDGQDLMPGVYIRKTGNKTGKVVIK